MKLQKSGKEQNKDLQILDLSFRMDKALWEYFSSLEEEQCNSTQRTYRQEGLQALLSSKAAHEPGREQGSTASASHCCGFLTFAESLTGALISNLSHKTRN